MLPLLRAEKHDRGFNIIRESQTPPRFAFIGVRSCELHAIAIQDRVFLSGPHVDPHYRACREGTFIVAVNCGHAAGTCFCVSMDTGPRAKSGFDLALTEIVASERHVFLIEIGTEAGAQVLSEIPQAMLNGLDDIHKPTAICPEFLDDSVDRGRDLRCNSEGTRL